MIYSVIDELYNISKIDNLSNPNFNGIILYNKSAYYINIFLKIKIDVFKRKFNNVVGLPFENYEYSEDIYNKDILNQIEEVDNEMRMYSSSLFYANKDKIINFIESKYSTAAKRRKMILNIKLNTNIMFNFMVKKKSTSVSNSLYNPTIGVCPNFRLYNEEINIDTSLFYDVLKNKLLKGCVKIEIDSKNNFLRISCYNKGIKVNFLIKGINMS